MWNRGGRSSALDRAQALLAAKRTSRGDVESVRRSAGYTGAVGGSVKTRSASPNTHPLFSDLSDLSSVSAAPEHGTGTMLGSAAAAAGMTTVPRPQSSLGGGGGRFLKKAPPPLTNSSQSPVSKSQPQQVPEHRNVSSSQRGSQTAALSRLAQIESCLHSRKQVQEQARRGTKPAENLTSDVGISPTASSRSLEDSVQMSAQSCSDQSLKGKRFLKKKTTVLVNNSNTVRSGSRAADAAEPSVHLETKPFRVVSGVSLESDEEDMRKLLGDSLESVDNSLVIPGRPSSIRTADKLSKSSQKIHSSPPPTPIRPSTSSSTAPPHRSSPFRFTDQAQAHFSPSVLSPSPSPPRVSPFPPGRENSPHRPGSPQRSLSSMSGLGEVLSLEELFSVRPDSEDPHSEMSAVSSEDFKINVMTLDDLVPAAFGVTEESQEKERVKHSVPLPGFPNGQQQPPRLKEKQEEQEAALDYQSDFESETEPDYSVSQVSEHLQGDEEEEVVSEVREEASDSDLSCERTEGDYSSAFSDASHSCTSRTSGHSPRLRRSGDSRSSRSSRSVSQAGSWTSSCQSRRRASTRKVLKEAAIQTQPDPLAYTWPAGVATLGPALSMTYMHPTPVGAHTLSAEIVEALSTSNPAVFALNEMLKQQLAMTRRFIESSRHLHSSLVQSLGPPSYRYTTLEDTKEYIRKHRPPKLTMEEALEEVLQEMRQPSCLTTGVNVPDY